MPRRYVRIAVRVRVRGADQATEGHLLDVNAHAGFIACDPIFAPLDEVRVDVLLTAELGARAGTTLAFEGRCISAGGARSAWNNEAEPSPARLAGRAPQRSRCDGLLPAPALIPARTLRAQVRLLGEVQRVAARRGAGDGRPGVAVRWRQAMTWESDRALVYFLQHVLGVAHADVRETADDGCRYAYHFGAPSVASQAAAQTPEPGALHSALGRPRRRLARACPSERPVDSSETPRRERRSCPRVRAAMPLTFLIGSTPHLGRGRDMSRAGLAVRTDEASPPIGSRVVVRLAVPHAGLFHVVMLTGDVIRHLDGEKDGGFAIRHTIIDDLGVPGLFDYFLKERIGRP